MASRTVILQDEPYWGIGVIQPMLPRTTKAAIERAARLRAIRERIHKEPNQRAFADRLGVSQARYNHWENGWPIPSDQVRKILDITPEVDGDYILWGDIRALKSETLRILLEAHPEDRH